MAGRLGRQELYRLARLGAEARLAALEVERVEILRSFPDLANRTVGRMASQGARRALRPRRRRGMSAAARKAVSLRMKKYWAGRRRNKSKTAQREG